MTLVFFITLAAYYPLLSSSLSSVINARTAWRKKLGYDVRLHADESFRFRREVAAIHLAVVAAADVAMVTSGRGGRGAGGTVGGCRPSSLPAGWPRPHARCRCRHRGARCPAWRLSVHKHLVALFYSSNFITRPVGEPVSLPRTSF